MEVRNLESPVYIKRVEKPFMHASFWEDSHFLILHGSTYLFEALSWKFILLQPSQSSFTYSKLTVETLEQGVKYVQSYR